MKITAYAKVNLSLEVYGRRADGYHALKSVVLPISLGDELALEPAANFTTDTGYGESDLCIKAARRLCERVDSKAFPVAFKVVKRIPAGGGLGGGSADAAATLLALNELWSAGMTPERLAEVGAEVGSDVPALVLGMAFRGPVMMEGRGERVQPLALDSLSPAMLPSRHLVLVNPGVFSSTAEVYANCIPRQQPATEPVNDLELPAVRLYPEIMRAMEILHNRGAMGVRMSGSGSTVFGFVGASAEADALVAEFQRLGLSAWSASPLQN